MEDFEIFSDERNDFRLLLFRVGDDEKAVFQVDVFFSKVEQFCGTKGDIGTQPFHAEPDLDIDVVRDPVNLFDDLVLGVFINGVSPAQFERYGGEFGKLVMFDDSPFDQPLPEMMQAGSYVGSCLVG